MKRWHLLLGVTNAIALWPWTVTSRRDRTIVWSAGFLCFTIGVTRGELK